MEIRKRKKKRKLKKILSSYKEVNKTTGKIQQKETKIELYIKKMLEKNNISYIQEKAVAFGRYKKKYDFLCYDEDQKFYFFIEADGSFWHARDFHDKKKPWSKLAAVQKKNVRNDKLKDAIAEKLKVPLLRFWEEDIKFAPIKVEKMIIDEVTRQVALKNPQA